MATSTTLCSPCSERHITKPPTYWCLECEEAICDDCHEHHKVLKATRKHELTPIDKYKSLPSFITDIQQSCTYHNEKYQLYCVAHAFPICLKCIKKHKKCNVIPLDEVIHNAKTSGHFQDLETRLMDLLHTIDGIQKDRKANLVSIEKRKEGHLKEIEQIRNQINKHLDKLEKEIKQDLGIYKVNTVDYTTSFMISCNLSYYSYVSIFADKIYYTDWKDNSVVCCDCSGSSVWMFKDESVLVSPIGITADNDGNVFVVGEDSSNVVIISNDGKLHRQILTDKDGLYDPSAIVFDKHTKKLLVANNKKSAFLYNVT